MGRNPKVNSVNDSIVNRELCFNPRKIAMQKNSRHISNPKGILGNTMEFAGVIKIASNKT